MGKNGAAMRAAKQNKTYTVTSQWLDDHDRQVIEHYKARVKEEAIKQLDKEMTARSEMIQKEIEETWKESERLFCSGDFEQNFLASIQFLLAISSRVLTGLRSLMIVIMINETIWQSSRTALSRRSIRFRPTISQISGHIVTRLRNCTM